jgi:ribonucleoside-diphosphate reductase alpha chain
MQEVKLEKIELTENQMKVIKDKYLRDTPTVEEWLYAIAHNIALSEILHMPRVNLAKVYDGVNVSVNEHAYEGKKVTMHLLHSNLKTQADMKMNFQKYISNLERYAREDSDAARAVAKARDKFYHLMADFRFLPNSPTLMNAGRDLQQLSACYVLPVDDSIEGIYDALKNMALIHKSGGGTGFSFSRLRPKNDNVRSTRGVSSGPVSFMTMFDKSTDVVKQGGTRRGANMGILSYDHPDIMDFINLKKTEGALENFNVSVAITKEFMEKVKKGEDYDLINPRTKEVEGTMNAKELWSELVKGAWQSGDPGLIMIDRINESSSNPTPHLGRIESTNPCGEQPLLPNEPCNLGSINLSKFVDMDAMDFDWEQLSLTVHEAIHFLDNVIDMNNYPLSDIEMMSKGNRRIGLGVMGWAEALVMLGIPYDSEQGFRKAEQLMKFINEKALEKSQLLAEERGVFPNWKGSIFDPKSKHFRGRVLYPRHCARTTIAPTGTIGIASGLQGAGIEPFFAIVYVRYNARAIDALKKGETPEEKDTFFEINPMFRRIAQKHNYFGMEATELWKKVDENHKAVKGLDFIPKDVQDVFPTSHDILPLDHVRMQSSFQKHTDNAVSKTVNLPNSAKEENIDEVYWAAWNLGLKGITVYRDGSKSFQVLNISGNEKKESEEKDENGGMAGSAGRELMARPKIEGLGVSSAYYEVDTGYGTLHVNIVYDEIGPAKVFANISPLGTEISGLTSAISILISKYLQQGGDPVKLLKHLNSIKGDKPYGFGQKRVDSIPHAISKALRDHLIKTGKLQDYTHQTTLQIAATKEDNPVVVEKKAESAKGRIETLYCAKCYSRNVALLAGCSEPTCFDCGYSKCG